MTEIKPKSLAAKLCAIMGEAGAIEKGGTNSFQNYKYVRESDVADKMRTLFATAGVFVLHDVASVDAKPFQNSKGGTTFEVSVAVQYTLINADVPAEFYKVTAYGIAHDTGDKALYKALSGAHKYFLMKTFNLGSEDDVENEKESAPEVFTRPTQSIAARTAVASPAKGAPVSSSADYVYALPFHRDGEDMAAIRAQMKKMGARFNNDKKWHSSVKLTSPSWIEDYLISSPAPTAQAELSLNQAPIDDVPWENLNQ